MSNENKAKDKDLDLDFFGLVLAVVREIKIVILTALFALICSTSFIYFSESKYTVNVFFEINPQYPSGTSFDWDSRIKSYLPLGWEVSGNNLVLQTSAPKEAEYYSKIFENLKVHLTNDLVQEAKIELDIIDEQISKLSALGVMNSISDRLIDSSKVLAIFSKDGYVITYRDTFITKIWPRPLFVHLVVLVSAILMCVFFILMKRAWQIRKRTT